MNGLNEGTANLCADLDLLTYIDYQNNDHDILVKDFLDNKDIQKSDVYPDLAKAVENNPDFICYRGTGNGRWGDNAEVLFGSTPTDMQEAAKEFADYFISIND